MPLGCGWAASRRLIAPDTYEIRCGVASVCYEAAGDECPAGFTELDRQEWVTGQTTQTQTLGPPEYQTTNTQTYTRTANLLTVRCNPRARE